MLDPEGKHNQGIYPLKSFLEKILQVNISEDELVKSNIVVKVEDPIDNKRRVDIVIFIDNNVYPIEAKVWAYDQPAQLYDYYHYYEKQNKYIDKIYYLTPTGRKPTLILILTFLLSTRHLSAEIKFSKKMKIQTTARLTLSPYKMKEPYSNLSAINRVITRLIQGAKLPHTTVHGLRHAVATILDEEGTNIRDISVLLGHSSVYTTEKIYINRIRKAKKESIDTLGNVFSNIKN